VAGAKPPAVGTAPVTPATKQLGIDLNDPAAQEALMNAPLEQRQAKLQEVLAADPTLKPQLQKAYDAWNSGIPFSQGVVTRQIRAKYPNISDQAIAKLMDTVGGK
jgi:hypothetical protein